MTNKTKQYLMTNNFSPLDDKVKLIDIFSMTNTELEKNYHVTLEALIDKYKLILNALTRTKNINNFSY